MAAAIAPALAAQTPQSPRYTDVGSERERILRVLQLTGDVPLYPWSVRGFSPEQTDFLTPASARGRSLLPVESAARSFGALRLEVLPLKAGVTYNSAFPFGFNDGPLWAGRGLTGSLSGGVAGRVGPLSFQFEPTVFDAQNLAFDLKPNGVQGNPFMDGFYPGQIDLPQRFGDKSYSRFDLGESSVRLDAGPIMAELSTAGQWWGPAIDNPLILGNNAPGFPHGALGTSHPINVWIGELHARMVWGRLTQSQYSPDHGADSIRFMSGVIGTFSPRGVPGLEVGAARFFHTQWPVNGLSHAGFGRPFEGILKKQLASPSDPSGNNPDNQLASIFVRWAFPSAGVEVYGEYGREDHNIDRRDLTLEPDQSAGYLLGLQRVWKHGSSGLVVARAEILDTRLSHLDQGRPQSPWYVHGTTVTQGHTNNGQLLGAVSGYGGGSASAALDSYDPSGRWTVSLGRMLRSESDVQVGRLTPLGADVMNVVNLERRRTLGSLSITVGASGVYDFNRDFIRDRFNLSAHTAVEWAF